MHFRPLSMRLILSVFLTFSVCILIWANQPGYSTRQKARYYYLEGVNCMQNSDIAGAYEYFRHANLIDPSYEEALSAIGTMRVRSSLDTLRSPYELRRSLAMMRPFVDKYPDDVNENITYGYYAYALGDNKEAIRVFHRLDSLRPDQTSTLGHLAKAYMAEGMIDSAINALSKYERIEGHDPNLTIEKVSYHFAKHDTVGALKEVSELVASNPKEASFLILKGNIFGMINQPDSAFHYFTKAERTNPNYGGAKLALADYYHNQGDSAMYDLKIYQALMSEDFVLEQKVGLLGEYLQTLLSNSQNTARGDSLFQSLRNQYPHEPQVLDLSARYSAAKGNYEEAIDEIGYAISQSPSDEKYRGQLMTYYIAADQPEKAMEVYREVLEFNREPMSSLTTLYASAAQQSENYPEAIKAYTKLIQGIAPSLPNDTTFTLRQLPSTISYEDMMRLAQIYTMIGDSYYLDKKTQKAFNVYENALLLDPKNALALNNYAYFLSVEGKDLDRAREMSEKSLEGENSNNPTFLDTYAWILYKAGDYNDALKYQEAAIKTSEESASESSDLYDHYGDILQANNELESALNAYGKALELDPNSSEIKEKIKKLQHEKK